MKTAHGGNVRRFFHEVLRHFFDICHGFGNVTKTRQEHSQNGLAVVGSSLIC